MAEVAATSARSPVAVAFGPVADPLFGMYHPPPSRVRARGVGVVLCNPLGHEVMSTHRTYRQLAERLSGAGIHVLRFDYHGTGDSSGHADDPGRVRAWLDSIGAAIDELRAVSSVATVDLVGVRFGATLAAVVADERRDVRGVVLWAPCASGRAYVRELHAFRSLERARLATPGVDEHSDEVAGYPFTAGTERDLAAIDLLARGERFTSRVLVVPRDDVPAGEPRVVERFRSLGVNVTLGGAPGYAAMMRDPHDSIVPSAALDAIVDWVRLPGDRPAAAPSREGRAARVLIARARGSARVVSEQACHFGQDASLFGILSEPVDGVVDQRRPAFVFLNVGANHRVGPNRMYVSFAREVAALGCLAFRFDVAGLGDSHAEAGRERRVYSTDSVSDVKEALSLLWSLRGVERVVLVGVCSGAYLAFHTALADPRVAGQILVNPQTFEWKENDSLELRTRRSGRSTRYYLQALAKREVWSAAIHGGVDSSSVAKLLLRRGGALASASLRDAFARLRGEPPPLTDVERAFLALSNRGVESLLVFSSNDGGLDMIESHLGRGARRLRGRKNVRLAIIEDADHTFTRVCWQQQLMSLITSFVEETFPA